MRIFTIILFSLFITSKANSEYVNPIKEPLVLSGSFAELRNNHFHAGIDIKTGGREGLPVFSVADGYVYRIVNSRFNTGKTLFIYHPSTNKVSSYAHLQSFGPFLNRYIKNYQYAHRTEEFDAKVEKGLIWVRKGQQIALSGNTGASKAPHLHFEIRDTNDFLFNPLLHGFTVQDNIPPVFYRLYLFPKGNLSFVNNSRGIQYFGVSRDKKGIYRVKRPIKVSGDVYFGISAFDYMNLSANICSPSKIEIFIDSQLIFKSEFDNFNQKNTRSINSYMDYRINKNGNKIHTSYIAQSNKLGIYSGTKKNGVFSFNEPRKYNLVYCIYDANGNRAVLITDIQGVEPIKSKTNPSNPDVNVHVANTTILEGKNVFVEFPVGSLFDDTYINVRENTSKEISQFNVKIQDEETPLSSEFYLKIKDFTNVKDKRKVYIVKKNGKNEKPYYTEYRDGYFIASSLYFGTFGLSIDENAPSISFSSARAGLSRANSFSFSVFENGSGIKRVDAYIDNKWILLNTKGIGRYTHYFDSEIIEFGGRQHKLHIEAEDYCGNISKYDLEFKR